EVRWRVGPPFLLQKETTMRRPLFGLAILGMLWASASPAKADIMFLLGNNPQATEENILLNKGTTGTTVFGETNQSNITVAFTSTTNTLTEPANGQARIEATSGAIMNIAVTVPGGRFEDLILNPRAGSGTATLTAVANEPGGGTMNFTFSYTLDNGENFVTILATAGETLASLTINAPGGFTDLQQPRISGASAAAPVPAPASLTLLGVSACGLLGYH